MRWTFGVAPLPQSRTVAALLRSLTGVVLSVEAPHPALDRLIAALRAAEADLAAIVPTSSVPRIGAAASADGRVYVDHASDIGDFNACFPTYRIEVDGDRAHGGVRFPVAYEGPPGLVHGGFLAVFFDCVIQHHNCEVGVAGKTTALNVNYRRPTPLLTDLEFAIERTVAERRIESSARLTAGDVVLCDAHMSAVAGDRSRLPEVSPRRLEP
jgi:hypothetical protein